MLITEVLEKLSLTTNLSDITKLVAEAARNFTGADGATFVLRDENKCYYADEDSISPLWKDKKFPMETCISGWCMIHGEVVTIRDIYQDARIPHDAYRPTFVKSLCMTPIRPEDSIGAIGTYWSSEHTPTANDIKILKTLANSTAVALQNLELRHTIMKQDFKSKELETTMFSMGHNLRTPLCAMVSITDILREQLKPHLNDMTEEFFGMLMKAGEQASEQIERMLLFYRTTNRQVEKKQIDLTALARETLKQVQLRFPMHQVSAKIEEGMVAYADKSMIRMVLENLISNAIKYSKHKDVVVLEIGCCSSAPEEKTFFVKDNGDGFNQDEAHKLFKPLSRLHNENDFSGTGLGLASVAKVIDMHGGTVRAEGKKNMGATFFFSLPSVL